MSVEDIQAENEHLRALIARAYFAIHNGFVGGEWAALAQSQPMTRATSREANIAEVLLKDLYAAMPPETQEGCISDWIEKRKKHLARGEA